MNTSPMATRCHIQMQVGLVGATWQTLEECPQGVPVGTSTADLMNRCMGCPGAVSVVDKTVERKPPKMAKKPPPKKKTSPPQLVKTPPRVPVKKIPVTTEHFLGHPVSDEVVIKNETGDPVPKLTSLNSGFFVPAPGITVTAVPGGCVCKADAVELTRSLNDASVDLIVFDPAYESLERYRKTGTTTRLKESKSSSNPWFETFPNELYGPLFREMYRILKPGSHLYMFCDEETRDVVLMGKMPQQAKHYHWDAPPVLDANFKYWKSIIWDKVHAGMGYHYRAQHEFILMMEKVEKANKHRQLNNKATGDVLSHPRLKGNSFYPTEKPFGLVEELVLQSSNQGDTCFDPFCGSGVLGQVCQRHGRGFILGDLIPDEAIRRLAALKGGQSGFHRDEETGHEFPYNGELCSVCSEPQFVTPSGDCCTNGHGGAPGVPKED